MSRLTPQLLLRTLYILLFSISLAACGGGGSSKASAGGEARNNSSLNGGGGFNVTVTPGQIVATYESCCVEQTTIEVATSGDPGVSTVYADVQVDGPGAAVPEILLGATYGSMFFGPAPDLRAGTYSGNLVLSLCADQACVTHLADSPYLVPYEFTIETSDWTLRVIESGNLTVFEQRYPLNALFQMEEGVEPLTTVLELESPDIYTGLIFPYEFEQDFILLINGNRIEITPLPHSAGDASFVYLIDRTILGGGNDSIDLPVALRVSPAGVAPDSFAILDKEVTIPLSVGDTSSLGNSDGVDFYAPFNDTSLKLLQFDVNYLDGDGWIQSLREDAGWRVDERYHRYINTTVDNVAGDPPGEYRADVTVTSPVGGFDTYRVVREIFMGFNRNYIAFDFSWHGDEVSKQLHLGSNSVNDFWSWTASATGDWFTLSAASGSYADQETVDIDYLALANLANNSTLEGEITLSSDHPDIPDYTFPITVTKALPNIQNFAPSHVVAGKPFTLTVTGVNFLEGNNVIPVVFSDGSEGVLSYDEQADSHLVQHPGIDVPSFVNFHVRSPVEYKASEEGGIDMSFVPEQTLEVIAASQKTVPGWKFKKVE